MRTTILILAVSAAAIVAYLAWPAPKRDAPPRATHRASVGPAPVARPEVHRIKEVNDLDGYYRSVRTVHRGQPRVLRVDSSVVLDVGSDYRFWITDTGAVQRVDFMPVEPIDGNAPYGYPEPEVVPPKGE